VLQSDQQHTASDEYVWRCRFVASRLDNLISSAVKYRPDSEKVVLSAEDQASKVQARIYGTLSPSEKMKELDRSSGSHDPKLSRLAQETMSGTCLDRTSTGRYPC
jgi:hypothetical protein